MSDEKKSGKSTKSKASTPVMPAIYADGAINMHSSMIKTEEAFVELWKGSVAAKSTDLKKAWKKAEAWKNKHS